MKDRSFLRILGVVAVVLVFGVGSAAAQTVLKFSHTDQQQARVKGPPTCSRRRWRSTPITATRCRCTVAVSWATIRRTSNNLPWGHRFYRVEYRLLCPHVDSLNLTMLPFLVETYAQG